MCSRPLFYRVVIEFQVTVKGDLITFRFSSPVLRGGYRMKIGLKSLYYVRVLVPCFPGRLSNPNAKNRYRVIFKFSSPVFRGGYRIDSSLKPITSIVHRENVLSKIVTNHLYYKCRMSHFLTTKFQLYSSYIILYFPIPKLVFIPDPENSPNFNKK